MSLPRWNSTARVLGRSALVLALTMTADSWAHWLKLPASGSGFHGCWLRGSLGSSDTPRAIAGSAKLTAHGSTGPGLVGAAVTGGGAAEWGAAVGWVVGCGVLATVESPDPHPLSVAVSSAAAASPVPRPTPPILHYRVHTTPHRTLTSSIDAAGMAERPLTIKLRFEMDSQDDPTVTFGDLQIHPSVLQALNDVGYESPSAIQAATIPALMAGSDVVGLAQTGTGKTAGFAIPMLSKIDVTNKATQALVLAPTRELALQVAEAFSRYGAHLPQINVLPIYGGSSYMTQLSGLKRGA